MINTLECDQCGSSLYSLDDTMRCLNNHVICRSCGRAAQNSWPTKNTCPQCIWSPGPRQLMTQQEYASRPTFEQQVMRKAWKMQFRWSKYLFRSPDLVLVILAWGFSLIFLISAGRNTSFFSNFLEWIVGTIFVAVAPILTLMFIRKKKSGLGMIAGWKTAWRGDLRPVWIIVGIASIVFLIHLMMEQKPIG